MDPQVMNNRKSWDEYFLDLAQKISERSTCIRRQIGAIAVREKRILATGYNGAPSGLKHCLDIGCLREKLKVQSGQRHELCRGLHAEQNVIIQAARFGISLEGGVLYIHGATPCAICAKMLINVGLVKIICSQAYPDKLANDLFIEANLDIKII